MKNLNAFFKADHSKFEKEISEELKNENPLKNFILCCIFYDPNESSDNYINIIGSLLRHKSINFFIDLIKTNTTLIQNNFSKFLRIIFVSYFQ